MARDEAAAAVYALDFRLSSLTLFSSCQRGQIGFGIGPSELCFMAFEFPLPDRLGAVCVLPSLIFDVENILDEHLSIFVFTRDKSSTSTGMKMTSRCDIPLKPSPLKEGSAKESQSAAGEVTIAMAEFQAPLHNSIGVGTLNGEVEGSIYLNRLDLQAEISKQPNVIIPPLIFAKVAALSSTDCDDEASLIEANEDTQEDTQQYSTDSIEPIRVDGDHSNEEKPQPICSPVYPKHIKHSLRYDLTVTEPETLQHYVEVDESRWSQATVDIVKMRPKDKEEEEEEDRSEVPWCLSMHYDDSHSLRVKGHNPPVPVNASIHRRSLQRQKEKGLQDRGPRDESRPPPPSPSSSLRTRAEEERAGRVLALALVRPAQVPRVARRYSHEGAECLRDSADTDSALHSQSSPPHPHSQPQLQPQPQPWKHNHSHDQHLNNRSSFSRVQAKKEKMLYFDDLPNVNRSMNDNRHIIASKERRGTEKKQKTCVQPSPLSNNTCQRSHQPPVPGLDLHKFEPMEAISFSAEEEECRRCDVIISFQDEEATASPTQQQQQQLSAEEGLIMLTEQINNIHKYSTCVENYIVAEPAEATTGSDSSVMLYYEN
jgi:hypothetical protein